MTTRLEEPSSQLIVIYDANVLYPFALRSFLMWLGVRGVVRARWTDAILNECFRNVLENNPHLSPERLARTRRLMCEAIPDSLVTGFETRIDALEVPDPGDRHVLAAAIEAGADIIVTRNLKDFPDQALAPHDVFAQDPDAFVSDLLEFEAEAVLECLRAEQSLYSNPPKSMAEVLERLHANGLTRAVESIRSILD